MRILLVEDDRKVASFIRKGLTEAGYAVDVSADGEEGLRMAEEEPYDLVMVDWMLPGQSGLAVCKSLRSKKPDIPILFLTAKDDIADKVTGLDAGADDYLTKPFSFLELLARIRTLLRRGTRLMEVLSCDDLEMKLDEHKVIRGGIIELSNKEFAILEILLRNKNRLVTRTELTEHVWNIQFDRGTNLIDVYINYLRKKLDTGSKRPLIHTVRGAGYMIKDPE